MSDITKGSTLMLMTIFGAAAAVVGKYGWAFAIFMLVTFVKLESMRLNVGTLTRAKVEEVSLG